MGVPEELAGDLHIYWYNQETDTWVALPTMVEKGTKTLQAFTDHFTVFDIDVNNWQACHLPTIDSFQVSGFTGAATYSYPIEVPPGPGGFQPNLSLSYNSQVVDQSTFKSQASWVGMGWSLDTGSIELNTHGTSTWTGDDTYSLNVGGVSTQIIEDNGGTYHAADENFWKINYDATNKVWTVKDKTGNTYVFEHKSSYPYQTGSCETSDAAVQWETYRWSLTKVTNIFEQEIVYTYEDQLHTLELYKSVGGQCDTVKWDAVAATYPDTITYANGQYRVNFNREETLFNNRTDYPDEWEWSNHPDNDGAFHIFERYRLKAIEIQYNTGTKFETFRQYNFTYADDADSDIIFPGQTWSAGGKTSTLRSVQQFGVGGASSLPAVTFTYDNLHLTDADNGYGGSVAFVYENTPWYYSNNARDLYTTVVNFGVTGYPCYGGVPVWFARPGSTVACGTGQYPPLSVLGSVYTPNIQNSIWSPYGMQRSLDLIRPGGMYKLSATINAQGNTMDVHLYDGINDDPYDEEGFKRLQLLCPIIQRCNDRPAGHRGDWQFEPRPGLVFQIRITDFGISCERKMDLCMGMGMNIRPPIPTRTATAMTLPASMTVHFHRTAPVILGLPPVTITLKHSPSSGGMLR